MPDLTSNFKFKYCPKFFVKWIGKRNARLGSPPENQLSDSFSDGPDGLIATHGKNSEKPPFSPAL
jgi:hypothetical protein